MPIKLIKIETAYHGWGRYLIATVEMPDGEVSRREIEDHGSAACVLPYDPARRTAILVRQFRAPAFVAANEESTLEAVAGIIEDADPETCARREAMEEAGLRLDALEHVVAGWTMPGVSTERMEFYLATYRAEDRVGDGGGIAHEMEATTVVEIGLGELAAMADSARLTDVKTLLLVQTLRLRRPDLFTP